MAERYWRSDTLARADNCCSQHTMLFLSSLFIFSKIIARGVHDRAIGIPGRFRSRCYSSLSYFCRKIVACRVHDGSHRRSDAFRSRCYYSIQFRYQTPAKRNISTLVVPRQRRPHPEHRQRSIPTRRDGRCLSLIHI